MPTVDYMDCFFTGPDTIAGKYMRKFWHPVARAEDLQPGWAKPIRILSEDFTLYRGDSGRPQIVDFRCPHRQSTLFVGWVEGDFIRCRFHGWKFDSSGQCVEQPAEKEAFTEKVRIRSCPTEEYLGLIFVYFGEGVPPLLPRYPDFEQEGLWVETYVRPCNFLNNIKNDPVHIPFTHKESEFFLRRPREIPAVAQEETEWGLMLTTSTTSGRVQYLHYGMPNILGFKESDRDHLAWRVPVDDESHASFQLDIQHVKDGIEGEAVKKRHLARTGKLGRSPNELGAAVLRGEIRIQDLAAISHQEFKTNVGPPGKTPIYDQAADQSKPVPITIINNAICGAPALNHEERSCQSDHPYFSLRAKYLSVGEFFESIGFPIDRMAQRVIRLTNEVRLGA